jgi:hypothetical protein
VAQNPPLHLFLLFFGYCLSGYVMSLFDLRKKPTPPQP